MINGVSAGLNKETENNTGFAELLIVHSAIESRDGQCGANSVFFSWVSSGGRKNDLPNQTA